MTVRVLHQARDYAPEQVEGRYVRFDPAGGPDEFAWCETGPTTRNGWRWDIRQGRCAEADLAPEIAAKARAAAGVWPSYVEWPA